MIKYYFVSCCVSPQDTETCAPFNLVKILEIDEDCFLSCVNESQTRIGLFDDFENDEEIISNVLTDIVSLHKISEEKYNELKKFLKL